MKKVAILLVSALISINLFSINAFAVDRCFSELADSEWNYGEPTVVAKSLNYDLVGTVSTNPDLTTVPKNWNLPASLFFENTIFDTTYRYIGKSCSERIIKVPGNFINFQTNPISEIESAIKATASNFEVGEKNLQTFTNSYKALNQVKANVNVFSNGLIKGKWLDWSWDNQSFTKFQESFGPSRSSFLNNLGFNGIFYRVQKNCAEFSFISDLNTDKSPAMVGTPQIISNKWGAMFINFNSSNACLIDTLLIFGNSENYKIYNFATFSLKPVGKLKNITINCKSGSAIKKTTALRPKCPAGFVKK
jgi:hypothetical protein